VSQADEKEKALRDCHALNPNPGAVKNEVFRLGGEFFDPRDVVQVKYEMLRYARRDGVSVSEAARDFGFSRPSFYQARADLAARGLPGLVPEKTGPRHPHKLNEEVMAVISGWLAEQPDLRPKELAKRVQERLGIQVHPRSIERSLQRSVKKGHQKQR
jgi:transposase